MITCKCSSDLLWKKRDFKNGIASRQVSCPAITDTTCITSRSVLGTLSWRFDHVKYKRVRERTEMKVSVKVRYFFFIQDKAR